MEAKQRQGRMLSVLTEMGDGSITERRRLKGIFLEKDKMQMSSYIKDLEKTISINKEIISDLMKKQGNERSVITKLNHENANLQNQLKKTIRERDDCQSKLLIQQQINEEYKGKEKDIEEIYREKEQEMLDQLNRKEFAIQNYERKFHRAVGLLMRYAEKDIEIKIALKELNADSFINRKITNLVEENEYLATEMKTAREKISDLEVKFSEIARAKKTNASKKQKIHKIEDEGAKLNRPLVPRLNLGHDQSSSASSPISAKNIALENTKLNNRISDLEKTTEKLRKENESMKKLLMQAHRELKQYRKRKNLPLHRSFIQTTEATECEIGVDPVANSRAKFAASIQVGNHVPFRETVEEIEAIIEKQESFDLDLEDVVNILPQFL